MKEFTSPDKIKLTSANGASSAWLEPGIPRVLPTSLHQAALIAGLVETGTTPKPKAKRKSPGLRKGINRPAKEILAKAVALLGNSDPLVETDFGPAGSPRMAVFSSVEGITPDIRDAAWDIHTNTQRAS